MRLAPKLIAGWPKLAWLAIAPPGADAVEVLHGPCVEAGDGWCAEAVWAGSFDAGDFDRTDLVYGSGVRVRDGRVIFVSPGTGVDRLWYACREATWYVSNSLPALLAGARLSLREDYDGYTWAIETVESLGLSGYTRKIPADGADLEIIYFNNLEYDGRGLKEIEKPATAPHFTGFDGYYAFLAETARRLGENLGSPLRKSAIVPMSTISSGYDSAAAAAIARLAGCRLTATITRSTSLWRGSDSGEEISRHLGMECRTYDHDRRRYKRETTVWAALGMAGGLNLTLFDYPEPLCLLFNGSYGDKVWDRLPHDLSDPVGDRDSLLGEFRLIQGVFHTVTPWWGIQRAQEINAIGAMEEMKPWALGTDYDRPIARRILEEAGVPRAAFGIRKRNTSSNAALLWPYTPDSQASLRRYLAERGFSAPGPGVVDLLRAVAHVENLVWLNVTRRLGLRWRVRPWRRMAAARLQFQWANDDLKRQYEAGLAAAGAGSPTTDKAK